jgi:hypothetical protein
MPAALIRMPYFSASRRSATNSAGWVRLAGDHRFQDASPAGADDIRDHRSQLDVDVLERFLNTLNMLGSLACHLRSRPRQIAHILNLGWRKYAAQGRLVPSYEAGIPSHLDVLERPQEQGAPVVAELFRGVRGRSANHGSPPVHRGPEPAFGRCALNPGPEGPGTSRLLIRREGLPDSSLMQQFHFLGCVALCLTPNAIAGTYLERTAAIATPRGKKTPPLAGCPNGKAFLALPLTSQVIRPEQDTQV